MGTQSTDVAIIGAGPYGLSLSTHLRARGVEHRVFGIPMQAWKSMSQGMYLKSFSWATNLPTAERQVTLPDYCRTQGIDPDEPVEIAAFARYGETVQRRLVPDVVPSNVASVDRLGDGFELVLENGDRTTARRVVVAIGLSYYEHVPAVLSGVSPDLVAHTAHVSDFSLYAGLNVAVIGRGQSALQAAALLAENGARPLLIARSEIEWHERMSDHRSLREVIRRPPSGMGPGRRNWTLEHVPMLMHYLPDERRLQFTRQHLGPCGAWWLRDRFEGKVEVVSGVTVESASMVGDRVRLDLCSDATGHMSEIVDLVISGTGYEVDVEKLRFLQPNITGSVARLERAPRLSRHFESSVPGLYFVGPSSAASFGPMFRFVVGASYTVKTVARHIAWTTPGAVPGWKRPLAYV